MRILVGDDNEREGNRTWEDMNMEFSHLILMVDSWTKR